MRSALVRSSVVLATVALTLTACAGAPPSTTTTSAAQAGAGVESAAVEPSVEPTPEPTSADPADVSADDLEIADGGESGTLDVPSYTNILLTTARASLELRGFTVEAVDASGQSRMVDQEDQWVVVAQDPPAGVVVEGSFVVLNVMHRDEING